MVQNGKNDNKVKIPMLNLGKIVDIQPKEFYISKIKENRTQDDIIEGMDPDLDGITVTDEFLIDATGTATSPLDALVDFQGSSENEQKINDGSFKNETTAPLNQDQTIRSKSKSRSRILVFKSESKYNLSRSKQGLSNKLSSADACQIENVSKFEQSENLKILDSNVDPFKNLAIQHYVGIHKSNFYST